MSFLTRHTCLKTWQLPGKRFLVISLMQIQNYKSFRYENLMRVQASRKLLLTGTPLQNNLVELMSLLVFVMPEMFANKKEQLKRMFAMFPRTRDEEVRSKYERDRIEHAKRIMKPFFLRRLKSEVLTALPAKTEEVIKVPMTVSQHEAYFKMVAEYKKRAKEVKFLHYNWQNWFNFEFFFRLRRGKLGLAAILEWEC